MWTCQVEDGLEFKPHSVRPGKQCPELRQLQHHGRYALTLAGVANPGHLHIVLSRQEDRLVACAGAPGSLQQISDASSPFGNDLLPAVASEVPMMPICCAGDVEMWRRWHDLQSPSRAAALRPFPASGMCTARMRQNAV